MASYSSTNRAIHAKTLTPSSEDVCTLSGDFDEVEVLVSSAATAATYFTTDNSAATVGGDATYVIPAGGGALRAPVPTAGNTVVRLIAAAANVYDVTGISR